MVVVISRVKITFHYGARELFCTKIYIPSLPLLAGVGDAALRSDLGSSPIIVFEGGFHNKQL